jgi:hypothetical protein
MRLIAVQLAVADLCLGLRLRRVAGALEDETAAHGLVNSAGKAACVEAGAGAGRCNEDAPASSDASRVEDDAISGEGCALDGNEGASAARELAQAGAARRAEQGGLDADGPLTTQGISTRTEQDGAAAG